MGLASTAISNFRTAIVQLTPTLDTSAYAAGDVLFDRLAFQPAPSAQKIRGRLVGVTVLDKDDQGVTADVYLLSADVTLGTANAAPSITDANAEKILGFVTVTASKDLGGCRFGQADCGIAFDLSTLTLYVAGVVQNTPTHTAAGLVLRLIFELE